MTYANDITRSGDLVERGLAAGAHLLERAAAAHARRRNYRRTLTELSALSNRDLADLGLARCDIERVARASAYGEPVR